MQKLKIPMCLRTRRGSVLVGVVAFTILMGIAASGYLALSGSTVSHEITALDDLKAYYAAESGLLVGTRWLRIESNWTGLSTGTVDVFNGTLNGKNVDVDIVTSSTGDITVESRAQGGQLRYTKLLSWKAHIKNITAGTVINDFSGNSKAVGFINMVFDGPFHMNTNIVFDQNSNPGSETEVKFVNGPVTVYSPDHNTDFDKADPLNTGDHAGYGNGDYNNYDYGVFRPNLKVNSAQGDLMDEYFTNSYKHSQDSIYLSVTYNNRVDLPVSANPANARATVELLPSGGANYTYYNGGWQTRAYAPDEINGRVLVAQQDINVYGTVKGSYSVATEKTSNANIHIVGEVTYADGFDPESYAGDYNTYDNTNNYGLSQSNMNNMVAIVSDNDILFEAAWQKPVTGSTGSTAANFTMTSPKVGGTSSDDAYVLGFLFAKDEIDWVYSGGMSSAFGADEMRLLGARSLDSWGPNFFETGNAMDLKFLYDKRLGAGLIPGGIGIKVRTSEGTVPMLVLDTYLTETNIPL